MGKIEIDPQLLKDIKTYVDSELKIRAENELREEKRREKKGTIVQYLLDIFSTQEVKWLLQLTEEKVYLIRSEKFEFAIDRSGIYINNNDIKTTCELTLDNLSSRFPYGKLSLPDRTIFEPEPSAYISEINLGIRSLMAKSGLE